MMTVDNRPAALPVSRRTHVSKWPSREAIIGWLFVLPALLMYAVARHPGVLDGFEDWGQEDPVGDRARNIGNDDAGALLPARQFGEATAELTSMPKVAIAKHRNAIFAKHDIGPAGQRRDMQPIA